MNEDLKARMMAIFDEKITAKGSHVGLSFCAFFSNKNNDPETLIEVAQW